MPSAERVVSRACHGGFTRPTRGASMGLPLFPRPTARPACNGDVLSCQCPPDACPWRLPLAPAPDACPSSTPPRFLICPCSAPPRPLHRSVQHPGGAGGQGGGGHWHTLQKHEVGVAHWRWNCTTGCGMVVLETRTRDRGRVGGRRGQGNVLKAGGTARGSTGSSRSVFLPGNPPAPPCSSLPPLLPSSHPSHPCPP